MLIDFMLCVWCGEPTIDRACGFGDSRADGIPFCKCHVQEMIDDVEQSTYSIATLAEDAAGRTALGATPEQRIECLLRTGIPHDAGNP